MVYRNFIKCLTCDTQSTIRVSVGHNSYQKHDFLCPCCEEPIGVGLEVDLKNATSKFRYYENCEQGTEEGKILNFNPHFVIPSDQTDQDLMFPWMSQLYYIQDFSDVEPILLNEEVIPQGFGPSIKHDAYNSLGGLTHITDFWEIIKKGWSLKNKNKISLSERHLKRYNPPLFNERPNFNNVIKDFSYRLILPKMYIYFDDLKESLKKANEVDKNELQRFSQYYINNMRKGNFKRYFEIYQEYFGNYSEYDQTILYTKNLAPIPDECIASSHSFNNTKMFYGNAYENYTTNIAVLACLNNIMGGRKFDEFKRMDLNKYLTIDKANRGNPFVENPLLKEFTVCMDSTLRNSSHHQSIELVDKGHNVEYQSGGTGSKRKMSYSKYIEKCNSVMLFSALVLLFEFELEKYY